MRKAIIENGEVVNVVECGGQIRLFLSPGQRLIDVAGIPAAIGDTFDGGAFYHAGVLIPSGSAEELRSFRAGV